MRRTTRTKYEGSATVDTVASQSVYLYTRDRHGCQAILFLTPAQASTLVASLTAAVAECRIPTNA